MSKLTKLKETSALEKPLQQQQKMETVAAATKSELSKTKEEEDVDGDGGRKTVEKSSEYKMAQVLTSDVNLMGNSMECLLQFDALGSKHNGFVDDIMFDSHCIHFGHFYRLFCAGRQPVGTHFFVSF